MESKFIKNIMQKKQGKDYQHISGIAGTIFGIFLVITILGAIVMDGRVADMWIGLFVAGMTILGTYILFALKVASQWEKAVVLRLGKFHGLRGPGVFWIVPIVDSDGDVERISDTVTLPLPRKRSAVAASPSPSTSHNASRAPLRARATASARPIPAPAPVTTAVRWL